MDPKAAIGTGYEVRDSNFWAIVICAILLVIVLVGTVLFSIGVDRFLNRRYRRPVGRVAPLERVHRTPPDPRLQVNEELDLDQLRANENVALDHYGWVDQTAGVIRLPVERAIEVVAQEGLPARQGAEARR